MILVHIENIDPEVEVKRKLTLGSLSITKWQLLKHQNLGQNMTIG